MVVAKNLELKAISAHSWNLEFCVIKITL